MHPLYVGQSMTHRGRFPRAIATFIPLTTPRAPPTFLSLILLGFLRSSFQSKDRIIKFKELPLSTLHPLDSTITKYRLTLPFSLNFCRYNAEEVTLTSYGDSETESDEDDDVVVVEDDEDDFENLDSVSVVAARNSSNRSVVAFNTSTPAKSGGANHSVGADSGRGESPESCSSSTRVVVRRRPGNNNKSVRPISAVPSEYSDISTSSYRSTTSAEDEESVEEKQDVVQQQQQQPVIAPGGNGHVPLSSSSATPSNASTAIVVEDTREVRMERVFKVASELLSTEEKYVASLHLIDQVGHLTCISYNHPPRSAEVETSDYGFELRVLPPGPEL